MASVKAKRGWAVRALPILEGILPIDPSRISGDVIAGATLAALAIPEVMGYTKIAGTPVITGLYTILLPIIFFAILGSSRHLVVGADSATAAILATGLVAMGAVADTTNYVELASLAALMCAALLVLARVLRLGFIANFLSRSVLIGFLTGVGIQVAMGQVGGMFGIPGQSGGTIQKFVETLKLIPTETSLADPRGLRVRPGHDPRPGPRQQEDPGRAPRRRRRDRGQLLPGPRRPRASPTLGTVPGGLPALGLPTAVMTLDNVAGPAAHGRLAGHRDPRPERGDLARLRDEVRRQLRRERGPRRPWRGQPRRRPHRHVRRQRQPHQDRDGRQRRAAARRSPS